METPQVTQKPPEVPETSQRPSAASQCFHTGRRPGTALDHGGRNMILAHGPYNQLMKAALQEVDVCLSKHRWSTLLLSTNLLHKERG